MGKKHKKHHKQDKASEEEREDHEKPLKLVLKFGGAEAADSPIDHESKEKKHKHKKKKKKKSSDKEKEKDKDKDSRHKHEKREKRKREREEDPPEAAPASVEVEPEEMEEAEQEVQMPPPTEPPPSKRTLFAEEELLQTAQAIQRDHKEKRAPLQNCLDYLYRTLQKKDVNGFFAYPVTDSIAPGYSQIITQPMDFSTIKNKVENNLYPDVTEFKKDFKLMCDNCTYYNPPETIFHKEANRILGVGLKILSKDNLVKLKQNLSLMNGVTNEELGLDKEEIVDPATPVRAATQASTDATPQTKQPKAKKPKMSKFEAFADDLSPEEILAQVQEAAKEAGDKLTLRKPNSRLGFLKRKKDGTTTLNLLNPENTGIVSDKEKVVSLGTLTGKLQAGTGNVAGFKEDKRNKATPVSYLNYGPFSSYAPTYDSSFANLSKEDSDLLLSTYGDDVGVQYARSVKRFVGDAGTYAVRMVDNLLDILTGGEHSKTLKVLEKKQLDAEEKLEDAARQAQIAAMGQSAKTDNASKRAGQTDTKDIDFNGLRGLSDLGIDMSFLDTVEEKLQEKEKIQQKLDETSGLISDLQRSQTDRLGMPTPQHLAHLPGPSSSELQLANKVSKGLVDLTKQVTPSHVALTKGVRDAMGITMYPVESSQTDEDTSEEQSSAPASQDQSSQADSMEVSQPEPETVDKVEPLTEVDDLEKFLEEEESKSSVQLPADTNQTGTGVEGMDTV